MSGPTKAGVRKQLTAMAAALQPNAVSRVQEAGLAQNYSPAMVRAAMGWGMDPALGAPLPRDPRAFLSMFDANMPQDPSPLDPRGPSGRPLPRLNQYPLAWNLPSAPGTYKMVPFRLMRNVVDMSHVARDCIGVRQQEIADVDWEIAPKEEERGEFRVFPQKKAGLFDQWRSQRKALQAFWQRPDKVRGLRYDQWIRMAIEEMLVTDSLAIHEESTWGPTAGVLGTDLRSLTVLDGTTIKPLLDIRGGPPEPPNPAYQQFIWGLPRVDMVSLVMDARDDPAIQDSQRGFSYSDGEYLELTRDQLAYMPYHRRAWTAYGFSNVEQCILLINVALKRLQWHNARFTDGDIPAMLVHVPDTWTLDQINKFEAQWHAMLAGDMGWKHRMKAIPGATEAQELKPIDHQMDFDTYVDRMICASFAVDPTEIGMPPAGGLGGSGYMEGQDDRRKRLTVGPILRDIKGYIDDVHARRLGVPELEIRYQGLDVEDESEQHKIDTERVKTASLTPNEYRMRRGEPKIDDKNADRYFFVLGREVLGLDQVGTTSMDEQQQMEAEQATQIASMRTAAPPAGPSAAQKSATDELDAFERFLKKPRARKFSSEILPASAVEMVYKRLRSGEDRKVVLSDLRKSVIEGQEMLASEVADALVERVTAEATSSLR